MTDQKTDKKEDFKAKSLAWKLMRFFVILILLFIFTGISSVLAINYIFPRLTTVEWLNKYDLFKKGAENIVVVNKTEQITLTEEQTISKYAGKSSGSVVEIISIATSERVGSIAAKSTSKIGSGIIVTADGLVITQADALAGKNSDVSVIDSLGKIYSGEVVLIDAFSNLALIKMQDANNLPVANFIASQDIKVGSKVVIMGRSGSDASISYRSGILSALNKTYSTGGTIATSEKMQGAYFLDTGLDLIQDPGMLGSAIVDYNGDVIGILSSRKEDQGMRYFMIPIGHVQDLINKYLSDGVVSRPVLGIYYLPLSKETASLKLSELDRGALVYSPSMQQGLAVIAGSPAEKAGIKVSDVILAVNGEEVNLDRSLASLIARYKKGEEISLKVIRAKEEIDIKVVLE